MMDVLRYDSFPCPEEGRLFIKEGMQPKCFILNTNQMEKEET